MSTTQNPSSILSAASNTTNWQMWQRTLARSVRCAGVGVHSGQRVTLVLNPSDVDTGLVFVRTDLVNGARTVHARWDHVQETRLSTVLGNTHGGQVATVEHLLAALAASGIDNCLVEIDGAEVPVMDGSSEPFLALLDDAGTVLQNAPKAVIEVRKTVAVERGSHRAVLKPSADFSVSMAIDFRHKALAPQQRTWYAGSESFRATIASARTFGFADEVQEMRRLGLGLGGSLDNAVILDQGRVLNEDGLRYEDECVRHKILDVVGDLALAGAPLCAQFEGQGSGHALNNRLLRALFADPEAFRIVRHHDAIH